jgi:hypothetical protein
MKVDEEEEEEREKKSESEFGKVFFLCRYIHICIHLYICMYVHGRMKWKNNKKKETFKCVWGGEMCVYGGAVLWRWKRREEEN